MYLIYLGEVLKRAFTPTSRMTDGLQIAAASALPALGGVVGVSLPESAEGSVLAYIGLIALALFAIRLFWAPYAMWCEQKSEIGDLKIELTKPERLVMTHLAKHRAKARAKLAAEIEDYQTFAYAAGYSEEIISNTAKIAARINRLEAQAGTCEAFSIGRMYLMMLVQDEADTPNDELHRFKMESHKVLSLLQKYLVGDITAESLALRLPKGIVSETPL